MSIVKVTVSQPQATEPKLTFRLDWLGEERLIDLVPYNKGAAPREEPDSGLTFGGETPYLYLSHAPGGSIRTRPSDPLPPPADAVRLDVSAESDGLRVALWVMEFAGETLVASKRWPLRGGRRRVVWEPSPETDGVRLALRVEGSGKLSSATLTIADAASQPQATGPKLTCRLDWLGEERLIDLVPYSTDAAPREEPGGGLTFGRETTYLYLSHAPGGSITSRPSDPLPPPADAVHVDVSAESDGPRVALWVMEFAGETLVATKRWPLRDGRRRVVWEPSPETDGVRLALRVEGPGRLNSATLTIADATEIDRLTESIWTSLNRPRSLLEDELYPVFQVSTSVDAGLGTNPTALKLALNRTIPDIVKTKLIELNINPDFLEISDVFQGPVVWDYLVHALKSKEYVTISPYTGAKLSSSDTFLISEPPGRPYLFVRFEAEDTVFYHIYDPFAGAKVGYYFPATEILVSALNLEKAVRVFRALAVLNANDFQNYLLHKDRRTAVPLSVMSHWGHVFYNELEALGWLFDHKMESYVDVWLESDSAFFKPEDIFPELDTSKLVQIGGRDALFRYSLEERLFLVRPQYAFHYVGEATIDRIRSHAIRKADRTGRAATIRKRLDSRWPVIWFEIRGNDRTWKNQAEGIPLIARKLQAQYPDVAIVLGGWSRLLASRPEDDRMIAADRTIVQAIKRQLPDIPCEVALGLPIWEKSFWAMNCHAAVTVYGSGMVFPWIAQIPKLLLSGKQFQPFVADLQNNQVEIGTADAILLPVEFTWDDEESTGHPATRNFYCDADKIAEYLDEKILKPLKLGLVAK